MKEMDFKDVNASWKNLKLLIYTGTLSCGVSFDPEAITDNFDTFINVFQKNCSAPTQFIQSFMWCRTFNDKEHHLLIEHKRSSAPLPITAAQLWNEKNENGLQFKYKLNDQNEGLKIYLDAWKQQIDTYSTEYIIAALSDMGFALVLGNNLELSYNTNVSLNSEAISIDQELLNKYIESNYDDRVVPTIQTNKYTIHQTQDLIYTLHIAKKLKIKLADELNTFNNLTKSMINWGKYIDNIRKIVKATQTNYKQAMSIINVLDETLIDEWKDAYITKTNFYVKTDKQTDTEINYMISLYGDMKIISKMKHFISTKSSFTQKELFEYIGINTIRTLNKALESCVCDFKYDQEWKQHNGTR